MNGSQPVYILQLASHRRLSVIIELNDNFNTIPAELQVFFSITIFAQPVMTLNLMQFRLMAICFLFSFAGTVGRRTDFESWH